MPILFQYLLKLSLSLAIMYLFYQFVLRRLTFYNPNRWYLAGYSLLCFFISFINISPVLERNEVVNTGIVTIVPAVETFTSKVSPDAAMAKALGGWTIWSWLMTILVVGITILLLRLVIQFFSFLKIKSRAKLIANEDIKFYQVNKNIIPFSFGNSIFINQHLHTEAELKEIVRHEFVHIKQKHTVDIIFSELLCILNWYNPFAWLIRKAIRQNLEFIADNKVLENGMDKKQYQYLLLKVIGNNHFSIASQFNFSSLKKRIVMMNKVKTARVHLIKFLFVLPLVAVLLLAFRDKLQQSGNENIEQVRTEIDTIPANTAIPPISTRDTPEPLIIVEGIHWPEGLGVNIMDANKIDSIHIWKNEKAIAMYGEKGKNGVIIITTKKQADANLQTDGIRLKEKLPGNVLYYLNDKQITKEAVDLLDQNKVKSINMLKGDKAKEKYGDKGKNGAVEIITKLQNAKDGFSEKYNKGNNNQPTGTYKLSGEVLIKENTTQAAAPKNADFREMTFIADTLVWNGSSGGFELKGNAMIGDNNATVTFTSTNAYFQSPVPLVYIDGKEADLNKNYIGKKGSSYKVVTLKKEEAQKKYGDKGKNGAVEITTKPASKNNFIEKPITSAWDFENFLPGKKKDQC